MPDGVVFRYQQENMNKNGKNEKRPNLRIIGDFNNNMSDRLANLDHQKILRDGRRLMRESKEKNGREVAMRMSDVSRWTRMTEEDLACFITTGLIEIHEVESDPWLYVRDVCRVVEISSKRDK